MPMPDDLNALRARPFAEAVEKLEKMLLAGSSRVFLIGAGCSKCAGLPLMADLTQEVLTSSLLDSTTGEVLTAIQHLFDGSADANIEDYLSEIVDLLAIADRRSSREAPEKTVSLGGKFYDGEPLRTAVDKIKEVIAKNIEERNVSTEIHQKFVRAVHRPKRAGMSPPTRPVDYLVLNYDTVLEDALALECVPFADGLDGGVTGWWSPQTFKRDGLAARIFKLHGSINWFDLPNDPLPRRVGDRLQVAGLKGRRILIWPASTKYRETQMDPYAQLTGHARVALNSGPQRLLVICGYRFRDPHINLEIDRALRESEGALTVAAFTSDNVPSGQLEKWHKDDSVAEQVLIFANRGFFHGTNSADSSTDLLWWRFENVTRLLGGER